MTKLVLVSCANILLLGPDKKNNNNNNKKKNERRKTKRANGVANKRYNRKMHKDKTNIYRIESTEMKTAEQQQQQFMHTRTAHRI